MQIEQIVFDLDGTLVDSVADLSTSLNIIRQKEGLSLLSVAEVHAAVGDGARKLIERTMPATADIDRLLPEFMTLYQKHLTDETRPYPGITELLTRIELPMAVVSNKPHDLTLQLLQQLELNHHFNYILGADGGRKKPDPQPVLRAICNLGGEAGTTLMVGDHHTDLLSGGDAGCQTCFCGYGYGNTGDATCNYRVESVEELAKLLLQEIV